MSITRPQPATRPTAIRIAATALHECERLLTGLIAAAGLGALIGGIPWGLWHYVGWPLPDHIPTWDEIQATLLSPMSPQLLLDVLACAIWPLWAKFTLDVALSIPDAIRRIPEIPRPPGPMRTLAGVLVGTIVVALLGNRGTPVHTGPSAIAVAHLIPSSATTAGLVDQPAVQTSPQGTAIVRPPENGIYDSLWRIAERELGDGNRWPTIWQLNRGKTQVDGRVFSNPNLIRPGWILTLPDAPSPPAASSLGDHEQDGDTSLPVPTEPTSPPSTTNPPPTSDSAPPTTATSNPSPHSGTGITTNTGAFVGFGLAALITVALITVRLWRRRTYRPGSGDREGLDIAPVVRALRIAHDEVTLAQADHRELVHPDSPSDGEANQDVAVRGRALASAESVLPADNSAVVGLRDSQAVALDLARTRGLGLVGPGAIAAARALLVNLLAEGQRSRPGHAAIVVPAADVALLLDSAAVRRAPSRLRIAEDLDEALGLIEAELLTRTRHRLEAEDQRPDALVLVATPAPHADRRLQAVLDNGSTLGIASILIGQWRPGGTVRVRADGSISASSPEIGDLLAGTRLFTLPSSDTSDLIDILGAAEEVTIEHADVQPAQAAPSSVDRSSPPARIQDVINESDGELASSDVQHGDSERPAIRAPLELKVLGRMHLYHGDSEDRQDLIDVVAPKQREILTYLALHPDGVRRDVLTATIWPEAPASRPANSFHATLSQLRKAIRQATQGTVAGLAINRDGHCRLDRSVVDVDLWRLRRTLEAFRRDPQDGHQRQALLDALPLYAGDLADGLIADWLDDPREVLRRDVLDAISVLAHEIGDGDPHQQLALLERARELDPYNEATYCAIARVQVQLRQHDSVPRTLALLTSALASIDQHPSPETIAFFRNLQQSRALASE